MKKWIGVALLCAAIAVAWQLHLHGPEEALGGHLAWLAPTSEEQADAVLEETHFYAREDPQESGSRRVPVTDAVRSRVGRSMDAIGRRQAGADR